MATYIVRAGDNLSVIARRHGLRSWVELWALQTEEFKRAHPNPNLIHPGDELVIPDSPSAPATPSYVLVLPGSFASRLSLSPRIPLIPRTFDPVAPTWLTPPPGRRPSIATGGGRPYCFGSRRDSAPPPADPLSGEHPEPWDGTLGSMAGTVGRALWECREVRDLAGEAGDWAADVFWNDREGWQRGLEIGVGVGTVSTLLAIRATREFGLGLLNEVDIPIGRAVDLLPREREYFRFIRPIGFQLLWSEEGSRGGIVTFDFTQMEPSR